MDGLEDRGSRPLIVTTDESLLDDLLRLAAAAGTVPEVASDAAAVRRSWSAAGVVVVGADLAGELAELRLPRREAVVLATGRAPDTRMWTHAVGVGAAEVLTLPEAQSSFIDLFGDCLEGGAAGGATVSVIGGCGGSGATTFAAALAMTNALRGSPTLLIDADSLAGGIDLVLGAEQEPGARWPDLAGTSGRLSAATLREALPRAGELSVLSWDRGEPVAVPGTAMRSVLSAGQRGCELLVVDLPRHLDASAEEAVVRSAVTLLVVPAEVRAVAAAGRVLTSLRPLAPRIGLVVRESGAGGLDAEQVGLSLAMTPWARMRPDRSVSSALEEGLGPLRRRRGPLASCCADVLDGLASRTAAA